MLKKLLIAAVAVIAGMVVLTKMTKISPTVWLGDCCRTARQWVPPEKQLQQLNSEIANIDKDIKKSIGRVAAMEEEADKFENQFNCQCVRLSELKTDLSAMRKRLEDRSDRVVFHADLTRKLDRIVTEYTCLKEKNKIHKKVLEQKKRTLEAANDRLTKMRDEKEKLTLLSARLAGHLEAVKAQQMDTSIVLDDSAIARCRELANDIETRLNTAEREAKLLTKYGYNNTPSTREESKSREEVLRAARHALEQDDGALEKVVDKEEK